MLERLISHTSYRSNDIITGMMPNPKSTSKGRKLLRLTLSTLFVAALPLTAQAQNIELKTNMLYWATTTPNIGLEARFAPRWTAQLWYGLNPWKQSGGNQSSLRHWLLMPEARYWFCQPFNGWFVGVHGLGGEYNAGGVKLPFGIFPSLQDHRYKGWYVGGGLTAGYQWPISKRWAFEAAIGLGYIYSPNDRHCAYCEGVQRHKDSHYVGPTKAALTLVYVLTGKDNQRKTIGTAAPELATLAVTRSDTMPRQRTLAAMGNRMIRVTRARAAQDGHNMTLNLTMNLDELRLGKDNQLVYTPIIHTPDSDYRMPEIIINGRREQVLYKRGVFKRKYSPDVLAVGRKNGQPQTVDYIASIPVATKLRDYTVSLQEDVCGCGDHENDSLYTVYRYHRPLLAYLRPEAVAQKEGHLDKRAYIDFPVDRVELYPTYRRNPEQLDSIIQTINALKNDKYLTVKNINIHGYASPESPYTHNDYLARNRAKTLTDYVRRMVDLPESLFTVSSTPEDWDGLRAYINGSNLEHKDEILAVAADNALDPDEREKKIKTTWPDEYRFMLATWYPALRHSDYHITYIVKPFDVDEAKLIIKTRPQLLSLNEMFMVAQTYEPGSRDFNEVMETAVRMYPDDATANLNAAITRLNAGDYEGAKPYLDKAGDGPEAQAARQAYEDMAE